MRYPENTVTTVEDFVSADADGILDKAGAISCSDMWTPLSDAAREAIESGRFQESKVLWTLADSFSMMLKPTSINEPFRALVEMDGGQRPALLVDFSDGDISLLSEISGSVRTAALRTRVVVSLFLSTTLFHIDMKRKR